MLRKHKGIIIVLIASLLLRIAVIVLAVQFREHPDILRWKDWGRISFLYGFADTYVPTYLTFGTYPNNMPPGTLYIVYAMYWLWLQMGKVLAIFGVAPGSSPWVNIVLLQLFFRIPSLVADLGIGFLIYRFSGVFASSLFLFNPAILFNSAFWGQMDAINNVFVLLALWLSVQKKHVGSYLSFTASILTKFSLVFLAPLVLIINKKFIAGVIASFVLIMLAVLPISRSPILWYWNYLIHNATGEMTNVTAFAFNLWWVLFHPHLLFGSSSDLTKVVDISLTNSPLTQTMYGPISLGLLTAVFSLIMQIPIYVKLFSKKISSKSIMIAFVSLAIIAYLTLPQMHERYLYPAFAPLAILIGLGVPLLYELIVLSLLNFINLVIVWHPMPLPVWMFDVMRNVSFQWCIALVTTLAGFWTVWKINFKK